MVDWPHSPPHRFGDAGAYFITGATLQKRHVFTSPESLDALQSTLFKEVRDHDCRLNSWCLLSNHYHLVIRGDGPAIQQALTEFHRNSAHDVTDGRVWFQYWDTQLTYESSWLARMRYTHENAVHHGLVAKATNYPWCSASWFEATAKRSFIETVARMKTDRVKVYDDY